MVCVHRRLVSCCSLRSLAVVCKGLAMDSALQNLQYHQSGDPNPSEVEQNYQG